MSLAIFPISNAKFLNAPDAFATGYLLCKLNCISGSGFSLSLEILLSSAIAIFLYPFGVFAPLPTAVPPSATFCNSFCAATRLFLAFVMDVV